LKTDGGSTNYVYNMPRAYRDNDLGCANAEPGHIARYNGRKVVCPDRKYIYNNRGASTPTEHLVALR